ncbi:aspartate semialdehyde dehydrogenase [Anaerobranca californiensis DSM 14826]|uniref:Aspartate-semialdehyde dehydrogenase n=1 Tax=Anaerobranca californiensis DSM 14826 TaxID=1120989 RepID=A0A1M6KD99_9FIRM|nr:aspartate-semialdehyde dehydrogenase [Anaerobranca californiensis]SHJ56934.1 aspartate semialdehyde dehydrogenase [Anaerobranca californiensis DSM 14826]
MKKYNIAIVGATGLVGREFLSSLAQWDIVNNLYLVASARSKGQKVQFKDKTIELITVEDALEEKIDVAFFCAGSSISKNYGPLFAKNNTIVIDNSSYFRMDKDIPLIVPEVNGHELHRFQGKIIANPNCSTIQLAVILKHIEDLYGLKRVVVSTYQSVSGAGQKGVDELNNQILAYGKGTTYEPKVLPVAADKVFYQMFNNILPQIDLFEDDGYTKEEHKMINETRKILNIPKLPITVTTVRVPVFRCHSESVNVETYQDINIEEFKEYLKNQQSVIVMDDIKNQLYPTPLHVAGKNEVFVGRIRRDNSVEHGLNMWIVADNVRKGAAYNGLQILLYLIENNLI